MAWALHVFFCKLSYSSLLCRSYLYSSSEQIPLHVSKILQIERFNCIIEIRKILISKQIYS